MSFEEFSKKYKSIIKDSKVLTNLNIINKATNINHIDFDLVICYDNVVESI